MGLVLNNFPATPKKTIRATLRTLKTFCNLLPANFRNLLIDELFILERIVTDGDGTSCVCAYLSNT
jgi:hypothetical protein